MRRPKLLFSALSVAIILASSANAASKIKKSKAGTLRVITGNTVPCHGINLFHCGPIYNGNDYLGDDADPFIRLMIQRDLGAKYGQD